MQEFKRIMVKTLLVRSLLMLLFIPPLSNGILSYRPYKMYKCIKVIDGDTVILRRNDFDLRVRLSFIDAPESNQLSFDKVKIGQLSKTYLESKILNRFVRFQIGNTDQYGRSLGEIFYETKSINLEMVKQGYAITYYLNSLYRFRQAEYIAKIRRLGIWKFDGFLSPWVYRKHKKRPSKLGLYL